MDEEVHCAPIMAATQRTVVERVDAFAVAFLILPSIAVTATAWRSMLLERYDVHVSVSEDMFEGACKFETQVKQLLQSTGACDLLQMTKHYNLYQLFLESCHHRESVGIQLLTLWAAFAACDTVHVEFRFVQFGMFLSVHICLCVLSH